MGGLPDHISVARSGFEAFAILAENSERFDYVISDVCMAEGNGLELLYQIRTTTAARNFRPDMCVILMSGVASADIAFVASRRTFPLNRTNYYKLSANKLQVA